jgi:hypothetical protein
MPGLGRWSVLDQIDRQGVQAQVGFLFVRPVTFETAALERREHVILEIYI